jgi:hypothetical protein
MLNIERWPRRMARMLVARVQAMTNEGARAEFEEQQLDGEDYTGDGRVEGGGHAGTGAAGQQNFSFVGGGGKKLTDQRTHRAAGLNNGTFGTEGTAGADGDGGGKRLQNRDFGFDAAAGGQHGFHGFGDAVAFNFFRTVFGHETDDQRADDRRDDDPRADLGMFGAAKMKRPLVVVGQVGEEADQIVKGVGDKAGENSDESGEQGDNFETIDGIDGIVDGVVRGWSGVHERAS